MWYVSCVFPTEWHMVCLRVRASYYTECESHTLFPSATHTTSTVLTCLLAPHIWPRRLWPLIHPQPTFP